VEKGHKSYVCPDKKPSDSAQVKRVVTPCVIAPKYLERYVENQQLRELVVGRDIGPTFN